MDSDRAINVLSSPLLTPVIFCVCSFKTPQRFQHQLQNIFINKTVSADLSSGIKMRLFRLLKLIRAACFL